MREVVVKVGTTGLKASDNKIIEIGCVEIIDGKLTGDTFRRYINPQMPMPDSVKKYNHLTDSFLKDKPIFSDVAKEFLDYIKDATLVMHSPHFVLSFLRKEFQSMPDYDAPSNKFINTSALAKRHFKQLEHHTLDDMCEHYDIDLHMRRIKRARALDDAGLLAKVYLNMKGDIDFKLWRSDNAKVLEELEQHNAGVGFFANSNAKPTADASDLEMSNATTLNAV
jgi:DNA polymerase III subunit epsilon